MRRRLEDLARPAVAPSILAADLAHLGDEIARVEAAGAVLLHVDVMDGYFARNLSFGPLILEAVRGVTDLVLNVHLMVEDPGRFIESFAAAGADVLTFHVETVTDPASLAGRIHARGCSAGAALNVDGPSRRPHPEATRGESLSESQSFCASPSIMAAIGDLPNDVPMFRGAGLGIAMGHARRRQTLCCCRDDLVGGGGLRSRHGALRPRSLELKVTRCCLRRGRGAMATHGASRHTPSSCWPRLLRFAAGKVGIVVAQSHLANRGSNATRTGDYAYICTFHPTMKATLLVK
ncbi:MAG: HAD hydrolase family protein [Longimicrobiales bacterium]